MQIPKIFHQVWLGGELPKRFQNYQNTWRNFHPNWKIILWNENNISKLKYLDTSVLNECANYSEKSDYLRFCILLEYGGVYIDTDFECCKNIEELIDSFEVVMGKEAIDTVQPALIASIPKQKIIKEIFQSFPLQLQKTYLSSTHKIGPHYISPYFLINQSPHISLLP